MGEKKTDRRTLKTRKAICDALAQLLYEKELRKVTVQEIADLADVNRVTFYKHYLDVYDLYEKIEKEVLVELGLLILQLQELPPDDAFEHLIGYIYDERLIFRMIFSPNSTGQLRDKFSKMVEGLFRQMQKEENDKLNDNMAEYLACYRAHGCIAVLEKWVRNDLDLPKDKMTEIISDLDSNTAYLT